MIRNFIKPKTGRITIHIPKDMINKNLELLIFPVQEAESASTASEKPLSSLMEKIFKSAQDNKISENINIDNLMNELSNGLS